MLAVQTSNVSFLPWLIHHYFTDFSLWMLDLLVLRAGDYGHEVTLGYIPTMRTLNRVIFLNYLEYILPTLVVDPVLDRLDLTIGPAVPVVAVEAPIVLI